MIKNKTIVKLHALSSMHFSSYSNGWSLVLKDTEYHAYVHAELPTLKIHLSIVNTICTRLRPDVRRLDTKSVHKHTVRLRL